MIDKPKRIDVRLLSSLMANKNRQIINDVVERRKQACIGKIRQLLAQEENSLKTTIVRSSEDVVRIRTR